LWFSIAITKIVFTCCKTVAACAGLIPNPPANNAAAKANCRPGRMKGRSKRMELAQAIIHSLVAFGRSRKLKIKETNSSFKQLSVKLVAADVSPLHFITSDVRAG
jgi:hypothetical protein